MHSPFLRVVAVQEAACSVAAHNIRPADVLAQRAQRRLLLRLWQRVHGPKFLHALSRLHVVLPQECNAGLSLGCLMPTAACRPSRRPLRCPVLASASASRHTVRRMGGNYPGGTLETPPELDSRQRQLAAAARAGPRPQTGLKCSVECCTNRWVCFVCFACFAGVLRRCACRVISLSVLSRVPGLHKSSTLVCASRTRRSRRQPSCG